MKSNKEQLVEMFYKIHNQGWIKSHRCNNTGIGKTFEDLVDIEENNKQEPDFEEFEIKTQRETANAPITLFTLAPSFPKKANRYLKDKFGEYYCGSDTLKKLHTSLFADRQNSYINKYGFQLMNDRDNCVVKIVVYNLESGELVDDTVGYTYEKLQNKLFKKLNNLFCVKAKRRFCNGIEEFLFTNAVIYTKPSFEKFLNILDAGYIQYDIRIGTYQSGKNYGKPHDHGSGFRVRADYVYSLYEDVEFINLDE